MASPQGVATPSRIPLAPATYDGQATSSLRQTASRTRIPSPSRRPGATPLSKMGTPKCSILEAASRLRQHGLAEDSQGQGASACALAFKDDTKQDKPRLVPMLDLTKAKTCSNPISRSLLKDEDSGRDVDACRDVSGKQLSPMGSVDNRQIASVKRSPGTRVSPKSSPGAKSVSPIFAQKKTGMKSITSTLQGKPRSNIAIAPRASSNYSNAGSPTMSLGMAAPAKAAVSKVVARSTSVQKQVPPQRATSTGPLMRRSASVDKARAPAPASVPHAPATRGPSWQRPTSASSAKGIVGSSKIGALPASRPLSAAHARPSTGVSGGSFGHGGSSGSGILRTSIGTSKASASILSAPLNAIAEGARNKPPGLNVPKLNLGGVTSAGGSNSGPRSAPGIGGKLPEPLASLAPRSTGSGRMTPALALPTHAPSEPVTALQPHPPSQGPSHPSRPPAGLRLNLSALQAAPAAVPGTEEAEIGSGRPGVPRLNLEPIVQEREAELAHEPAYMVAAEPDESEELVRRRAPPVETPDTYYYYPKFKDKDKKKMEAFIKKVPDKERTYAQSLLNQLVEARQNCEHMVFRGHRMLDQVQKGYKAQLEEVKDENATLKAQLTQIKFLVQWAATNHEPGEQVSGALKDELVNMLLSGQLGQGEEGDAEMGAEEGDAGEQQQAKEMDSQQHQQITAAVMAFANTLGSSSADAGTDDIEGMQSDAGMEGMASALQHADADPDTAHDGGEERRVRHARPDASSEHGSRFTLAAVAGVAAVGAEGEEEEEVQIVEETASMMEEEVAAIAGLGLEVAPGDVQGGGDEQGQQRRDGAGEMQLQGGEDEAGPGTPGAAAALTAEDSASRWLRMKAGRSAVAQDDGVVE